MGEKALDDIDVEWFGKNGVGNDIFDG